MMLEYAARSEFAVGSNLRGGAAAANWCFLLPALEFRRILCVGVPRTAAITMLSRLGGEVVVVAPTRRAADTVAVEARQNGLANVVAVGEDGSDGMAAAAAASVDLVWVSDRRWRGRIDRRLLAAVDRVLGPDGLVYLEASGRRAVEDSCRVLRARLGPLARWTLSPHRGEPHLAVPERHAAVAGFLSHHGFVASSPGRLTRRLPAAVTRLARPVRRLGGARIGFLAGRRPVEESLPEYVRVVAAAAGVEVGDRPWALWAPGRYESKKVIFLVFDRSARRLELIVKLPRARALNHRLDNEWQALGRLRDLGIGDPGTLPRPAFFGSHGGLAVLGQTAVDGVGFERRTNATADCADARRAREWLVAFGIRTIQRPAADGSRAGAVLDSLHRRFSDTYTLGHHHRERLAAHVLALSQAEARLPPVFQHGDPGVWNVVVTASGQVGFLDWEAAEPQGMPLWDVFYLMRSFGVVVARAGGRRPTVDTFAAQYLQDTPLSRLLAGAIARFCRATNLDPGLVGPLLSTCWMHRALKESTRLRADRLDDGHYVNLLRRTLVDHDAPGLRRLCSLETAR
ncbi:MAG: hypothetical protein ACR2KP_03280 [Egibacteraceae bacterium]